MAGRPALFPHIASFAVVGTPAASELQEKGRTAIVLWGVSDLLIPPPASLSRGQEIWA